MPQAVGELQEGRGQMILQGGFKPWDEVESGHRTTGQRPEEEAKEENERNNGRGGFERRKNRNLTTKNEHAGRKGKEERGTRTKVCCR